MCSPSRVLEHGIDAFKNTLLPLLLDEFLQIIDVDGCSWRDFYYTNFLFFLWAKHRPMASNSLRLGPLSWLSGSLSGRNGWVSGDLSVARFSSKSRHRIPGALEANSLGFRTFRHH